MVSFSTGTKYYNILIVLIFLEYFSKPNLKIE